MRYILDAVFMFKGRLGLIVIRTINLLIEYANNTYVSTRRSLENGDKT